MLQIQVDKRKINVLYLVEIINAKDSRCYGSVVILTKIWRSGFDSEQGCYLLLLRCFVGPGRMPRSS